MTTTVSAAQEHVRSGGRDRAAPRADLRVTEARDAPARTLQRAVGNQGFQRYVRAAAASSPATTGAPATSGRPLYPVLKERLEAGFGTRLDDVRVHDGAAAADFARSRHAHAVTLGREIRGGDHLDALEEHQGEE